MIARACILTLLIAGLAMPAFRAVAQEQDENDPARAAALIRDAIQARGGEAYLNIRTVVSEGQYTPFDKGVSTIPAPFVDYVVYPDRVRTEFGKGDRKFIQANAGNTGWIYDAQQKMIREQTEEQVKSYLQGVRYDLDNVLRHGHREAGARLIYVGRREPLRNTFSEAVRVEFADGGAITIHFDPRTKLPMVSEYKTVSGEATIDNQVRFYRWLDFGGVKFATIQDFYRNGQQSARANFENVRFNVPVADSLFTKPASIKEVK